ncbi:YqcI/YcgG family protein [Mycolicibacterium obuense]|nr:YqcI/YcgG family protein [Mycolicibacterium obuense]
MFNASDDWMSPIQAAVHRTISDRGGYRPPTVTVLHLIDELGEYLELNELRTHQNGSVMADQIAAVWLLSVCIANQFEAQLQTDDLLESSSRGSSIDEAIRQVFRSAGLIARVINYYDGAQWSRPSDDLLPLSQIIAQLHVALRVLADHRGLDLAAALASQLKSGRIWEQQAIEASFDPSTASCLLRFQTVAEASNCLFARSSRLWGAPDWQRRRSIVYNVGNIVPYFSRFCRAAEAEVLDGFVIAPQWLEPPSSLNEIALFFRNLLTALTRMDPGRSTCMTSDPLGQQWQFEFSRTRLFITVFSPLYKLEHPRYAQGTYILFQPEFSFSHHQIGNGSKQTLRIKAQIRAAFEKAGVEYHGELIDERQEAKVYILPHEIGASPVPWWMSNPEQDVLF